MRRILFFLLLAALSACRPANPVSALLDRIDPGASRRVVVELVPDAGDTDYFEIGSRGGKPLLRGSDYVSIATGLNWYLKYYCGIHLGWNCMQAELPSCR